jgi:transposase
MARSAGSGEDARAIEAKLTTWHLQNKLSLRLAGAPGIGPIGASRLVMKVSDPQAFRSGRNLAGRSD